VLSNSAEAFLLSSPAQEVAFLEIALPGYPSLFFEFLPTIQPTYQKKFLQCHPELYKKEYQE
jgi:hypothetical protein